VTALRRTCELDGPYDLERSLLLGDLGRRNPTLRRVGPGQLIRASHTPEGPASYAIAVERDRVELAAWGPGAAWALDALPRILGLDDRPPRFDGRLARLQRSYPGIRAARALDLFDLLTSYVIRQRVAWRDAVRSQLGLLGAYGSPAPGPHGLVLPLAPAQWRALTSADLAGFAIERKRAVTLLRLAREAERIHAWAALAPAQFGDRIEALPGIGPWTRAMVLGYGLGELDVVPLGDYDLPSAVSTLLADEPRADDARMLELLAPYAGQRFRVIRMLVAAGVHAPRFGPRKRFTRFG
jgi:3-methyladenine DNA glycosylase/8-oxoguanine DNA glycosylase